METKKLLKIKSWKFFILNVVILTGFTSFYIVQGNAEFVIYASTLIFLIYAVAAGDNVYKFMAVGKVGFVIWLFLHLLGGCLHIDGVRLYDSVFPKLIGEPYHILRYDQYMHVLFSFIVAVLVFSVIRSVFKEGSNKVIFGMNLILVVMGVGAVNEIIEFSSVVVYESSGVGGYYNNALDQVFNFTGAVLGLVFLKFQGALSRV